MRVFVIKTSEEMPIFSKISIVVYSLNMDGIERFLFVLLAYIYMHSILIYKYVTMQLTLNLYKNDQNQTNLNPFCIVCIFIYT